VEIPDVMSIRWLRIPTHAGSGHWSLDRGRPPCGSHDISVPCHCLALIRANNLSARKMAAVVVRLLLLLASFAATVERAAATAITNTAGGQGPWESKMPDFSWDTVPVAYHGANYREFSDKSIALLAKYPVITLEKCQGWRTLEPQCKGFSCLTCCEEDVYAAVGRKVKALNPRTKVVAYLHSNKVMPWYRIRQTMHNYTDMDYCYNGDASNETTCTPANTNEVFYDFRKQASLEAWSDACINMTKTGYVDGCFADGALKIEAPVGKGIRSDFLARKQSMLRAVQAAVPGPVISGSGGGYNANVAASQVQSFSTKHVSTSATPHRLTQTQTLDGASHHQRRTDTACVGGI
jgi:hypothetical protein